MPLNSSSITPDLFAGKRWPIIYSDIPLNDINETTFDALLDRGCDIVGMAAMYGKRCILNALVLSTRAKAVIIRLPHNEDKRTTKLRGILQDRILCNRALKKLAFSAERIAAALYHDHGLRIDTFVDVQSLRPADVKRESTAALVSAFVGEEGFNRKAVVQTFLGDGSKDKPERAALRAWATWSLINTGINAKLIEVAPSINTASLDTKVRKHNLASLESVD